MFFEIVRELITRKGSCPDPVKNLFRHDRLPSPFGSYKKCLKFFTRSVNSSSRPSRPTTNYYQIVSHILHYILSVKFFPISSFVEMLEQRSSHQYCLRSLYLR